MRRRTLFVTSLALAAVVVIATAGPAQAAKRRVPFGFFGVVAGPVFNSDATLNSQMGLMARSGVESMRLDFGWAGLEPSHNVFDFSSTDPYMTYAARHGLSVLALVDGTPTWASSRPSSPYPYLYAPKSPQVFANFMRALVERYGPHGTFWRTNPGLRPDPIREWEIWNEESFDVFWKTQPWAPTYTRLLRAAYGAIHHADHGAKVVLGSLAATGNETQWGEAQALYRAGAKHYFDAVDVHAFSTGVNVSVSTSISHLLYIFAFVRKVMRENGDGRKPIIDSELTWPAAVGFVKPSRLLGLETTPRGEQLRLTAAYSYLATHMRQTGVTQAFWYIWSASFNANDPSSSVSYEFAGLTRLSNGVFTPRPVLSTYAGVAARYEGCRKSSNARVCR